MNPAEPTIVRYERKDDLYRVTIQNIQNVELHEVITGLLSRLPLDEQRHLVKRFKVLTDNPDLGWISPVAAVVKMAGEGTFQEIDLGALKARGERVQP